MKRNKMPVIIKKNIPLLYSDADMLVVPIHVNNDNQTSWNKHPIRDIKQRYPLAYAHFRRLQDAGLVEHGVPVVSSGIESKEICWLPVATDFRREYKIKWVARGLRNMNSMRLHHDYSIAFPALGAYESDGVNPVSVYKIALRYFSNSQNTFEYLTNY